MRIEGRANGAVGRLSPRIREHFALDPIGAMRDDLGLIVDAADHLTGTRREGGACDGISYLQDGVVLYAPSVTNKRQNFTLAHEVGHWLIDHDDNLLDWLADQDEPGALLEVMCDAIAQRLLLPDDLIDSVLSRPVRVADVVALSNQSTASLSVSVIAAASRLPVLGAAILVDRATNTVATSAIHPDPDRGWPVVYPWRGDALSTEHPLASLTEGATLTRKSFWTSRWGRREDFYFDAVGLSDRVVALLSASDIWKTETLSNRDTRDYIAKSEGSFFCCGKTRTVRGFPCPTCHRQFCPECGSCDCTRRALNENECSECHTLVGKHLLTNGKCEWCA